MPNYKAMYLRANRGIERAVRELIQTQRDCEEIYLSEDEPKLILLPGAQGETGKNLDFSENNI